MRVYFVNHSAVADHLGGSEISLLNLISSWQKIDAGLRVTVVTPSSRGAMTVAARQRGHEIIVLPYEGWALFSELGGRPESALRVRRDFATTRRLIERMRADRPDLVVTNTVVAPWGAYAAAALGIPHVWFVREFAYPAHGFIFPAGREKVLADVGLMSRRVVANSFAVRDSLVGLVPEEKLLVAYPPVDVDTLRGMASEPPATDPFPGSTADLRVAVVSRVTRSKGQWRVVEALGLLRQRGIRVDVCFVGAIVEGGADTELRERAARLGVDSQVVFVGEQPNPFPYLLAAEVGVTPSDQEAFGRSTLECLALGRPVIATATGGSGELVVDGGTGFLVDPSDVTALADRLERYARDSELRETHGRAAAERGATVIADNAVGAVIGALVDAAAEPGYLLPATVVDWLEVPVMFSAARPWVLSSVVRARHLGRRLRQAARHPIETLRRRRNRRLSIKGD